MRNLAKDIRRGLQIGFKQIFDHAGDYNNGRCVAFMALEGGRTEEEGLIFSEFGYYYGFGDFACPECNLRDLGLSGIVVHLNDAHRWAPEQVADWAERTLPEGAPVPEPERELALVNN